MEKERDAKLEVTSYPLGDEPTRPDALVIKNTPFWEGR